MKALHVALGRRFPAARLVLCVILVAAATGAPPTLSQAAGIITHDAIVQRAIDLIDAANYPGLADLLNDYPEVVNYGAMFPDWAYAIGKGILAEVAHDTSAGRQGKIGPFRAALTANLLRSFRSPGSEDNRKAVAFLLGVISHDDADIPYHFGDGATTGLQPLAEQAGIPHWAFELGSDLYLSPALTYGVEWLLPEEALLAAYKTLDPNNVYHVNTAKLHFGRAAHQAQYTLERAAAAVVDPGFVLAGNQKEKLKEYYALMESYAPGGLQHGASRTAKAWQDTWDWLSTYTPVTTMSLSPAQPADNDGAYRQPVIITLSAADNFHGRIDTGPFEIMYSLNGGITYQPYTEPFVISSEGVYHVSAYSVDSFGNSEAVQNLNPTIGG